MQAPADAVPDELADERVARGLGGVLDRRRDVADVRTRPDGLDARRERRARDLHQALGLGRDLADGHGHRRIAVVALVADAEVEPDDIAVAERPAARRNADSRVYNP